jgi:hypothetical protein
MAKKIIPVEDLVAAANARRSPLYVWMLENHAIFRVVVTEAIRPNWAALAQRFAAEGLNDADGKAPTAETVRQTWWRHRHVNFCQMMRSRKETYYGGYATYWAQVSDRQTLKAVARVFR